MCRSLHFWNWKVKNYQAAFQQSDHTIFQISSQHWPLWRRFEGQTLTRPLPPSWSTAGWPSWRTRRSSATSWSLCPAATTFSSRSVSGLPFTSCSSLFSWIWCSTNGHVPSLDSYCLSSRLLSFFCKIFFLLTQTDAMFDAIYLFIFFWSVRLKVPKLACNNGIQ